MANKFTKQRCHSMIIENTCKASNDEGNDDLGIYQHCHHSLKHEETDKNTNT